MSNSKLRRALRRWAPRLLALLEPAVFGGTVLFAVWTALHSLAR